MDLVAECIEEDKAGILDADDKYLATGWAGGDLAQQIRERPAVAQRAICELFAQEFLFAVFSNGCRNDRPSHMANNMLYMRFEAAHVVFGGDAFESVVRP